MAEPQLLVAKYKYDAQESKELSIAKNEVLTLIDGSGKWWKVRNEGDVEGFVPSNFVRQVNWKDAIGRRLGLLKESLRRKSSGDCAPNVRRCQSPVSPKTRHLLPSDQVETVVCKAQACFDYKPCRNDELLLHKGDRIDVLEKSTDGWWRGICRHRCGWFPSNYVTDQSSPIINDAEDDNDVSRNQHRPSLPTKSLHSQQPCDAEERKQKPLTILSAPNSPLIALSAHSVQSTRHQGVANGSARQLYANKPWYFGKLSRERSQRLLDELGADGDFLIRDSESNPGDLSISLKAPSKNKHFWIQVDNDGFRIGNRRFSSVDELIAHYTVKPISSNGRGENLYLIKPFGQ